MMQRKYKNATNNMLVVQKFKFAAVSPKKSEIRLSPIGCAMAETNRSNKFNAINKRSGSKTTEIIKNIPKFPKEFLIKTLPAIAKSKPPDRNPPIIGTPFPIAYFAARRITPS